MADVRGGTTANRDGLMTEEQLRASKEARYSPPTTALNLGAVLALADDAPERNPRSDAQEVQALMYRDLQRLARRVNRLEQLS